MTSTDVSDSGALLLRIMLLVRVRSREYPYSLLTTV